MNDINDIVVRAIQSGAIMDGGIKHEPFGAAALLRSPDGHMLALFQPTEFQSNVS